MAAPGSAPCGTAPLDPAAGDCELRRGQAAGPLLTPVIATPHLLDTCAAAGGLPAPWGIPSLPRVPAAQWGGFHRGHALFAPSSVLVAARWGRPSASDRSLLIDRGGAVTVGLLRRGQAGARTAPLSSSRVLPPLSVQATPSLRLTTSRAASSVPRVGDGQWTAAPVAEPTPGAGAAASVYCPRPLAGEAPTVDPRSVEEQAGSNGYSAAMADVSDNLGGTSHPRAAANNAARALQRSSAAHTRPPQTTPGSGSTASGCEPRMNGGGRSSVPLPFVRNLRMHMDSCPSTNKSQFFYGGLGLLLACGLLDSAMVIYMVVGHTKFGPDLVARAIAGRFNQSDVFNHAQLVNLMRPYATAGAYDVEVLQTWKRGSHRLFAPIDHIMSYRSFLLLADDGSVNLGEPAVVDQGFKTFPDPGLLVEDAVLQRECKAAAARSLHSHVLPSLRNKKYRGVGRSSMPGHTDSQSDARLLPTTVSSCRLVRLFTRRSEADKVWREQQGWMTSCTVDRVNTALAHIQPYSMHSDLGKMPYGAKAKSLREQYEKFVPRMYTPDKYDVSADGYSGMAAAVWRQEQITTTTTMRASDPDETTRNNPRSSGDAAPIGETNSVPKKKRRWKATRDADSLAALLLGPPYNGKVPTARAEWTKLAAAMSTSDGELWDVETLKKHGKAMVKKREDLFL